MKPKPPKDLWERIRTAVDQIQPIAPPRPEGAFSISEFAEKLGLTINQAHNRLQGLMRTQKVKRFGSTGRNVYYVFIE